MKKIVISIAALLISAPLFAANTAVCDGGGAGDKAVSAAGTPLFIQVGFTQKCSANVFLNYDESATVVTVAAANKKGKFPYTGTSAGGAVVAGTAFTGAGTAQTPPSPGS